LEQHPLSNLDGVHPLLTHPQQDRQQFGVSEGSGALHFQPFSGPF
jgi:hypothetical protein